MRKISPFPYQRIQKNNCGYIKNKIFRTKAKITLDIIRFLLYNSVKTVLMAFIWSCGVWVLCDKALRTMSGG